MPSQYRESLPLHPKIIFMGTPDFALPTLEALIRQGHNILCVVTQPDRPRGRGKVPAPSPVKILALEHKIDVLQPERAKEPAFLDLIQEKEPDLIIVVAYGQILRKGLLDIPKWGVLNIHASLLPRYRGAAPIQRVVLNEESVTGLTLMRMDEGMDTGPILFQEEVSVNQDETAGQLHDKLALKAGDFMIEALYEMARNPVQERLQDHSQATYAPKIDRSMGLIDWRQPARRVSALIKGLDSKPGAYTSLQGKEIKLFSPRVIQEGRLDSVPGRVSSVEGRLLIETGNGVIEISEVQYEGRRRLPTSQFLLGFTLAAETILGDRQIKPK